MTTKNLIRLDEHRPHYSVHTEDGDIHVIPRRMFEEVVVGRIPWSIVSDGNEIIRTIIKEWMEYIDGECR